jgi:mRNA interferase HigB
LFSSLPGGIVLIENRAAVYKFVRKHADARLPFAEWIQKVEAASWKNLLDVKSTFNSADYVKGLIVFNVGGNNFRILAEVVFVQQIVRIARVGTQAQYDGWKL